MSIQGLFLLSRRLKLPLFENIWTRQIFVLDHVTILVAEYIISFPSNKKVIYISSDDEPNKSPPPRATTPTGMSSGSSSDSDAPVQNQGGGTPTYGQSDSGSDSDDDIKKAQNTALPTSSDDSDDDNVNKTKPASEVDNMFGDMSSDESGDEKTQSQSQALPTQDDPMAGSDDEEKRDQTIIPVEIPKINTDLGEQINFVRFPNFLSVEPKPFDPAHYEDEVEEDDDLDEEGRTRLKLKVENTIRWRKVTQPDGTEKVESNAKIVRWSDGSQSLILGNEKYDIQSMKLKGDFNHLFIRQGTGLQGQVKIFCVNFGFLAFLIRLFSKQNSLSVHLQRILLLTRRSWADLRKGSTTRCKKSKSSQSVETILTKSASALSEKQMSEERLNCAESRFVFDIFLAIDILSLATTEDARARNAQEHGSRLLGGR